MMEKNRYQKIITLTLKRKWFDLIKYGIKLEEYREIKPYWTKRLLGKDYDTIIFRNGYSTNAPIIICEYKGLEVGDGNIDWGAEYGETYYVIKLGKILDILNDYR